ncbi:MAG: class I SAM-dependent methyltransferase, partial [Minisyncoccia bacterium]
MIYRLFIDEPILKVPTLDIACGSGAGSKMLALATGCPVLGIDYSAEALAYATRNNASPGLTFRRLDLTAPGDRDQLRA